MITQEQVVRILSSLDENDRVVIERKGYSFADVTIKDIIMETDLLILKHVYPGVNTFFITYESIDAIGIQTK